MGKIDLHMHSLYSLDGEYTPKELIGMCLEGGLRTVALTDHNCVRGVKEMAEEGRKAGVRVIPGIELDCTCNGTDLHLLGYEIAYEDSRYYEYEQSVLEQKRAASVKQMKILREMGILFKEDKVMSLAKDGIVVGEMVAEVALADPVNACNPLLTPFMPGGAQSDNPYVNFFWEYCAQGKEAYVPVRYFQFEEALALITDTGGKAVIAHPVNTVGRQENMIAGMAGAGVWGIEVFSSYHSREDIEYYKSLARRLQLVPTMGSDFHGKCKPSVFLGKTGAEEEETGELFREN